jgi:glycosyltransferase involved in cell wall biosynthesis
MKFACVTLSFNQGNFLSETIQSIINQGQEIDYLVYDPGSKDQSRDIIRNFESDSVRAHFVEGDDGPADGLNKGIDLVNGDIFYYLNADDRVLPGAFQFVRRYFKDHPDCDVLHGSINLINEEGRMFRTLPAMKFSPRGYALGYSFVYQQATFIRKKKIPINAFNVDNEVSWDGELIVDLALSGASIHQTQMILGDFRIYPASITGSGRLKELAENEHKRIALKILGRDPHAWERVIAYIIRKLLAAKRRMKPQLEYLN